ncbi:hypothetical protein [Furfurilactobacillus rossiae]|uniref:Uncharacterized protein n=1 Tax=Furfurilactobacillus rossiae DSM 15814 TaxID=1114972 RepID=A0A0R1RJQ5_9LACO|nr:hypothetical protein [Furfurilactobacillus rossiae]KRL57328.1 hypothetical protein FD35_GL000341 [Furfurilactobacillus rossiae DSM 15814]QFR65798.1 hypothetical protein LR814_01180 [Furfurilactobacillus rossiae]QLE61202.1 hypothetical protein LROSRS0_1156 [Furfurilactobacillus rossiae]
MEQLMPNTYINPVMTKSTIHHSIRHLSIVSNHSHLSVGQRIRKFFTAERGDTLRHPQFSSDVIIAHLDRALKQHAVVSIMLNQPSNPFAKKLTTVTGTLRQDQDILTITNHATGKTYLILPEQIRQICFGLMVA